MKRKHDWVSRLARFLKARWPQPFAWGTNDCALFACDAALEITGTDLAHELRGKYDSEETAQRALAGISQQDFCGYCKIVAHRNGLEEIGWQHLQRGDLAFIPSSKNSFGGALSLVNLNGTRLLMPGEHGLELLPIRIAKSGWRIP
jgi:hypothetical protein